MNGSGNLGSAIGTITFPWLVDHLGWNLALQVAGSAAIASGLMWMFIDFRIATAGSVFRATPGLAGSRILKSDQVDMRAARISPSKSFGLAHIWHSLPSVR